MTSPARRLRHARLRAGLTQRELAAQAGVPQSTVARIELGVMDPRVGTLERLLRACGMALEVEPVLGEGVDRSLIREMLGMTPEERVLSAAQAAVALGPLHGAARR